MEKEAGDRDTTSPHSETAPSSPTGGCDRLKSKVSEARERLAGKNPTCPFEDLYLKESRQLGDDIPPKSIRVLKGTSGEPWVAFTPEDRFGLALSGGGIRSATFNLGLLQTLAHLGVLKQVHYLSTVSGGGYVGGFWTAWLARHSDNPGEARFPLGNDQRGGERAEVRHLREFSRFLLPRVGVMQTELWGMAMTVLGGLVPSMVTAAALLFLSWSVWVGVMSLLLPGANWGVVSSLTGLGLYLAVSELRWSRSGKSEHNQSGALGYSVGGFLGWVLAGIGAYTITKTNLNLHIYGPAAVVTGCLATLLVLRVVLARFLRHKNDISFLEGFERCVARFLGLATALTLLSALWSVAGWIQSAAETWALKVTAGGAAISAALFAWAKKWLLSPREETQGSNLMRVAIKRLKRATPKLLASLAWLLLFLLVAMTLQALEITPTDLAPATRGWQNYWLVVGAGVGVVLAAILVFDPARVGMHEFYRSRISRCYLGASNPDGAGKGRADELAERNRFVNERPGDDVTLADLQKISRPIHLVCVAANDISGDHLGGLYRGARSAVLSVNGISLGDETAELNELRLSAALTASAAAFNSQMGRVSMDLGPAVTFLMSALNLRLGLWVPHPRNTWRKEYTIPGRFFLYELLGRSRVDRKHLHLSDGNHFENFGLYELIRRHCRHIIVSDCGADPEVAFDDLANVLRRVREDFGVEIELDINPLRPGPDGLSRQHAVVGTIHYDGNTGMDKGTILFFKSTLTGDEPPDVLQYRTRNPAFPHESTGDQFYDEAQWESYRRLGEHAARVVLGSFEQPGAKNSNPVDHLFLQARARWHPAPERQHEAFLELSDRCASIEADLMGNGPRVLRAEFFSEAAGLREVAPRHAASGDAAASPAAAKAAGTPDERLDEELQILGYLMRIMQIMEDVWLSADLDHFWSHPLNEGWMNYFQRWAATPSFRRWWPILAPIYSPGFRDFAKERFGVGVKDEQARGARERAINAARLKLRPIDDLDLFRRDRIWQLFSQRFAAEFPSERSTVLGYDIELLGYDGKLDGRKFLVGFALVTEKEGPEGWTASWRANEFYVPPALNGSGILARMLDAVIAHYQAGGARSPAGNFVRLEVEFSPIRPGNPAGRTRPANAEKVAPPKLLGTAARYERVRDIEFYKSREFHYSRPENPQTGEIVLVRLLHPPGVVVQVPGNPAG